MDPGQKVLQMQRLPLVFLAALAVSTAYGEGLDAFVREGKAGVELRYRFETVEQDDRPATAEANTLRLRLNLASGTVKGFSAFAEFDHVEALGDPRYDDTRNGLTQYPVVPDPEGSDLNQAWMQFSTPKGTFFRAGRQRIALDNERFISAVAWRQNEQTFDAFRIETNVHPAAVINYAYVDQVNRVFGPDDGLPPDTLESDSHLLNARTTSLPVGTLTLYGYWLDFRNAPQLSADTFGAHYGGERELAGNLKFSWALEYAVQQDAGANAAEIDADFSLVELRLQGRSAGLWAGREVLSGESGVFTATTNPAFQTPLATPHKWQGWADKFATTPAAGIEDIYLGVNVKAAGWTGQLVWHDFSAEATAQDYGSEWDVSVSRKFADRYELLVKYADYAADDLFADTQKVWLQLGAAF
jgi:hypothetical protein